MPNVNETADVAILGGGPGGYPTLPEAMLQAALGFRDAAIHTHSR